MSKSNLLTTSEIEEARKMGWGLFQVFDLKTRRVALAVLPSPFPETGKSAHRTFQVVNAMAQRGHGLCQKAVRLVAQSNMGKK